MRCIEANQSLFVMKNKILNIGVSTLLVGLMFINVYMSMPNKYTFDTDYFYVEEGSPDSVLTVEELPPFLDTLYSDYCPYIHYTHDSTIDSVVIHYDSAVAPVVSRVSSDYGWRWGRMHYGLDYSGCNRDTSVSSFDGVVRYSSLGYNGGYGNLVVVRHYNGLETYYAHHWSLLVEEGDTLLAGDPIGVIGSTGRSTGPHLHYETRFLGVPIDPEIVLAGRDSIYIKRKGFSYGI